MSEDECVDFIVENGVVIPDGLISSPNLSGYVKSIIQMLLVKQPSGTVTLGNIPVL